MGFYIALPSDSSSLYFSENTMSGFTTKLPREIALEGEWECGVTEIRYPMTFFNVVGNEITITRSKNSNTPRSFRLPPGFYRKGEVIAEVNKFMALDDDGKVELDKHTGKACITTGIHPLYMSSALYDFLGHKFKPKAPDRVFEQLKTYRGQRVVDGHRGFDTVFVYCDILEPRIVGDTTASLLVTLENASDHYSFGDVVTNRFAKIRYYPVAKRRFHTIRIDIRTDVGAPVEFQGGKVFVEIHFRKVINA